MREYPVLLQISGARVLIAGAGRVAARRAARLLQCGAKLIVIAPRAQPQVRAWAAEGRVRWYARRARRDDVRGVRLVMAATDDRQANDRLAAWARSSGALFNRADGRDGSDFRLPAVATGPHTELALSSGGRAPAAVRRLKRELQAWLRAGPDRFVAEIARVRRTLEHGPQAAHCLRALSEGPLLEACRAGDEDRIAALVGPFVQPPYEAP